MGLHQRGGTSMKHAIWILAAAAACGDTSKSTKTPPAPPIAVGHVTVTPGVATAVQSADGRLRLDIPAGAVSQSVEIGVEAATTEDASVLLPGVTYTLTPDGT